MENIVWHKYNFELYSVDKSKPNKIFLKSM